MVADWHDALGVHAIGRLEYEIRDGEVDPQRPDCATP